MTCGEIIKYVESWAPKEIAWNKDNVGLQVGSLQRKVKNILLSLDLNLKVLNEAVRKNCNLIISHHPLLFNPIRKIDTDKDQTSLILEKLIKNNLTLYSAHTNLDFTKDGVSFELAKTLKLKNIRFLSNIKSTQFKLIIFVPDSYVQKVANAVFENDGGIIGEYSNCSFRTTGEGTFKGSEKTSPSLGTKLNFEKVNEVKLEVLIDSWRLGKILAAVKKVHPYEEMAYDVYPLNNENINYGMGAIGELEKPISRDEFLLHITKCLRIKNFRYSKGNGKKIKTVAVCGGSGSELIPEVIKSGADSFITADVKYHTFFDNEERLLLVDAGHYETEILVLKELSKRLSGITSRKKIKVYNYSNTTNPVIFYNNSGAKLN